MESKTELIQRVNETIDYLEHFTIAHLFSKWTLFFQVLRINREKPILKRDEPKLLQRNNLIKINKLIKGCYLSLDKSEYVDLTVRLKNAIKKTINEIELSIETYQDPDFYVNVKNHFLRKGRRPLIPNEKQKEEFLELLINAKHDLEYYLLKEIEELEFQQPNHEPETKGDELTTNQQIILLDYLGVLKTIDATYNKLRASKLIAKLTGKNEQNIRKGLTDFYSNDPKDKDCSRVKDLLNNMGLDNLIND